MIISELSYLEDVSQAPSVVGGACFLQISIVNGKASIISKGCSFQKVNNGSNITEVYQESHSFASGSFASSQASGSFASSQGGNRAGVAIYSWSFAI